MKKVRNFITVVSFALLLGGIIGFAWGEGIGHFFTIGLIFSAFVLPKGILGADALIINESPSWSGPALDYMLTRLVVGTDTLDKKVAELQQDVSKLQWSIERVDVTVPFQHYAATPVSNGIINVDNREITLQKFELYVEFNPQTFEKSYFEQGYSEARLIDETLPGTPENYIMMMIMERLNQYIEFGFFNSHQSFDPEGTNQLPVAIGYPDNTLQSVFTAFFYNGFINKALNDATTQQLTYVVGGTQPATIRATVLDAMYAKLLTNPISQGMIYKYGENGLRYIFNYFTQSNYELALQRDEFKNIRSDEKAYTSYRNYDTVPVAGLNSTLDTIFLCIARPDQFGNLKIGMNSTSDMTLDMKRVSNPSDLWYIKGIFKMDVNHGFGDQMCVYTNITA